MDITPQTNWRALRTEIPEDLWVQELKKKGALTSPLFEGESNPEATARAIYQYIVSRDQSAEFWLAICGREHTWGTNPNSVLHRGRTKSWTNARSVRAPGLTYSMWSDPVRKSKYVKYERVLDSVIDGVYRISDPTYAYKDTQTIGELVRVWAPAEDANDPEGYAWFVANYIEGIRSRKTPQVPGGNSPLWTFVPADSRHYTKGRTVAWPDTLIQHHTDGWDSLAWLTTSPNSDVSATHLLNHDGTHRAQLVRHEDTPHTTGYMNPRSISCEWERKWPVQKDIPDATYQNIARFWVDVVRFERARGNPNFAVLEPQQLRDHNDYYDTVCPGNLEIGRLFEMVSKELNTQPKGDLHRRYFPQTGKWVVLGFKALWEQTELLDSTLVYRLIGYPITNEGDATLLDGTVVRCQFFERTVFKYDPAAASPWDLTAMLQSDVDRIESFSESQVDP